MGIVLTNIMSELNPSRGNMSSKFRTHILIIKDQSFKVLALDMDFWCSLLKACWLQRLEQRKSERKQWSSRQVHLSEVKNPDVKQMWH